MGRFDGILICSDVDGTLAAGTQVSQRNLDAIRYFQSEGGLFTLSTGRSAGYEKTFSFRLNAPMITENGARVYDPESRRTLRTVPLEESGALLAWLDRLPLQVEGFRCSLCYPDGRVHLASGAVAEAFAARSGDELLKVVCAGFQDGEEALVFQSLARSTFADLYSVVRSWDTGVEFLSPRGSKGSGLLFLKEFLGDRVRTAIAVGDYENDLSMLRTADRAFAPANALEDARNVAEKVLCDFREGAIADLIELLDDEYERGILS